MDFEGFYNQLCNVDWTYHYSDDASAYRAGEAQVNAIMSSPEEWQREMVNTYLGLTRIKSIAWESTGYGKRPIDYLVRLREMIADFRKPTGEGGLYVYNKFMGAVDEHYANGVTHEAVSTLTKLIDEVSAAYSTQFQSVNLDLFLRKHNIALRKINPDAYTKSRVSMDYIAVSDVLLTKAKALKAYIRANRNVFKVLCDMKDGIAATRYTDSKMDYHVNATVYGPPDKSSLSSDFKPSDALVVGPLVLFS